MNDSGDAVQQAMHFYKLDMDAPDRLPRRARPRAVQGQGEASAAAPPATTVCARSTPALGPDFRRVRIGIGHPGPGRKDLVTPHVLGNYAKAEMEPLSDVLARDRRRGRMACGRRRRALHERSRAAAAAERMTRSLFATQLYEATSATSGCSTSSPIRSAPSRRTTRPAAAGRRNIATPATRATRPQRPAQARSGFCRRWRSC